MLYMWHLIIMVCGCPLPRCIDGLHWTCCLSETPEGTCVMKLRSEFNTPLCVTHESTAVYHHEKNRMV